MFARVTCVPPLGHTTTLRPGVRSVTIKALVESSTERPWSVSLWSNHESITDWSSLDFKPEDAPPTVLAVQPHEAVVHRRWYSLQLTEPPKHGAPLLFTVRFRSSEEESWAWAGDQLSNPNGTIIYPSDQPLDEDIKRYIPDISSDLQAAVEKSDTPDTVLWSLTYNDVPAACGKQPGCSYQPLGKPAHYSRWFALVRLWSPWLAPRQGRGPFCPDKEAVLAAFERDDGTHLVLLAVSGVDDVLTTLFHSRGIMYFTSKNDGEQKGAARIIAAVGRSLDSAIAAVMYHARSVVMRYEVTTGELVAETKALQKGFKPEWLENWYDGLAYCTWNGLGQQLHEDKVLGALDALQKDGINVTSLIIDDNWQSLNHEGGNQFENGWMEFEATKVGFPRGLQATVKDIRAKHKNIKHIAVWHAMFGYWGGIAPEGKIAKEYKTKWVQKKDGVSGGKMLVVTAEDAGRFYKDFYQFLSSCGIDAVKTDAQFFLDELSDADDRRAIIKEYQDVWSINQLRFFAGKAISCMSQSPQLIFHSQLPSNKPRILLRNSDDFFPEVPASHPWHIFCNAHNAIFNTYLNILPDWDMFQTQHSYGSYHAAARCVSGGPIYITDIPGKHDIDLIHQMTGNTPRGDTVILRPHTVGKSTMAYNSYDDPILLKIGTYVGMACTGASILGVFNCTQHPLSELIGLEQFPGAEEGTYIIRSYTSGAISRPTTAEKNNVLVQLDLGTQGWEILSAFPVQQFELQRSHEAKGPSTVDVTVLGLLGKMTGAAAIVSTSSYIERGSGRLRVWTSLKAMGTYGLYISDLKKRDMEKDFLALIFGRPIPFDCVKVNDKCENVLEIDVKRAWEETGSNAGWSNEVVIEVVVR